MVSLIALCLLAFQTLPAQSMEPQPIKAVVYQKHNVDWSQNETVMIMSLVSDNDIDWIATWNAENGLIDPQRKHPYINRNGTRDWGCGLNSRYHSKFINSPAFYNDEANVKYCREVYLKRPTAFYAYKKRFREMDKFYLVEIEIPPEYQHLIRGYKF